MAFKMAPKSPLMKQLTKPQEKLPEGLKNIIEAQPESPATMMDSPTKLSEGEKYDIKMASDQNIKPSARKNYAENAEAAQKSAPTKNMNKGYGTPAKNMNKGYGSPALQTSNTSRGTIGGKSIKDMQSAADVPRTTSFGGNDYHLGFQSPSGQHYYNEGYSFKDGKQGKVERPGDEGIYHVSRPNEKPIPSLKSKKAKITTAKTGATKLATVNTEKPKVSKTKRETRRGKRADKLEKRVNKLRGDSPVKQVSLGNAFSGTKHKLMNPKHKNHRDPHTDALRAFRQGDPEPMKNENARKKAVFIAKAENSGKAQAYTSRANKFGIKKPKIT